MAENDSVETRVGQAPVFSIEMGVPSADGSKPAVRQQSAEGSTAEFDENGVTTHESDQGGQTGSPQEDKGKEGGTEGGGSEAATHDLPAFDPNNQAVVDQYTGAYLNAETNEPNLDALSAAWFKNAKQDASGNWQGALPDDVYAYLDTQGFPKALVKSVEAGQVALLQQSQTNLYARAGGEDNLQKAVEWGKSGGYTEAQRERFNALINGRDQAAAMDQIDLLMQRFNAATGNGRRATSRVNPRRSVAASAGASGTNAGGGAKGYETRGEWQADVRKARAENNQALLNETRVRLKASKWYQAG